MWQPKSTRPGGVYRTVELDTLATTIRDTVAPDHGLMLIEGAAGSGKTITLDAVARELTTEPSRYRVVQIPADLSRGERLYGALASVLAVSLGISDFNGFQNSTHRAMQAVAERLAHLQASGIRLILFADGGQLASPRHLSALKRVNELRHDGQLVAPAVIITTRFLTDHQRSALGDGITPFALRGLRQYEVAGFVAHWAAERRVEFAADTADQLYASLQHTGELVGGRHTVQPGAAVQLLAEAVRVARQTRSTVSADTINQAALTRVRRAA